MCRETLKKNTSLTGYHRLGYNDRHCKFEYRLTSDASSKRHDTLNGNKRQFLFPVKGASSVCFSIVSFEIGFTIKEAT